jgi:hypothetical protein
MLYDIPTEPDQPFSLRIQCRIDKHLSRLIMQSNLLLWVDTAAKIFQYQSLKGFN